jgi:hypothetical protein
MASAMAIVPRYTVFGKNVGRKLIFKFFLMLAPRYLGVCRSWSRPRTESTSSCVLERTTNTHCRGATCYGTVHVRGGFQVPGTVSMNSADAMEVGAAVRPSSNTKPMVSLVVKMKMHKHKPNHIILYRNRNMVTLRLETPTIHQP